MGNSPCVEIFDLRRIMPLLDSPEQILGDDPIDVFDVKGEVRWLVREN